MVLTAIAIILVLQRLLGITSSVSWRHWTATYQLRVMAACHRWPLVSQPLMSFLVGWLSFVLIIGAVLWCLCTILGPLVYFLISLLILWSLLDGSRSFAEGGDWDPASYFLSYYSRLFGVIFWFVVLGAWGGLSYVALRQLHDALSKQSEPHASLGTVEMVLACVDWVPTRLCSLTFVVLGHFSSQIGGVAQAVFVRLEGGLCSAG